ncbi:PKD protein [candidate division SR1 bacterium RAAC1_SR1_1]|nr:PKD protein [candidate division SR1 bacterium RAAC1_SR1_1]
MIPKLLWVHQTITTTPENCGSADATATVNGVFASVQWYDLLNNPLGTNATQGSLSSTGTYHVVVTNTAGCDTTINGITVSAIGTNPTVLTSNATGDAACFGTSVIFTATTTGATLYEWSDDGVVVPSETGSTFTTAGLTVGTHNIVVRSQQGACWSTSNTLVFTVHALPNVTITTTPENCGSADATATVNGVFASVQWYDLLNNPLGTNATQGGLSSTGTYHVVVTNTAGCDTTINGITVSAIGTNPTVLTSNATGDAACFGTSVIFTATTTGATLYEWSDNGVVVPGETATTFTTAGLTVGTHNIVVRSQQGACWSTSNTLVFTVHGYPTITSIVDNMPLTICGSDIITYTITVVGGTPNYTVSLVQSTHPYVLVAPNNQPNVTVTSSGGTAQFDVRLATPPASGTQITGFTTGYIVIDSNGCYEP